MRPVDRIRKTVQSFFALFKKRGSTPTKEAEIMESVVTNALIKKGEKRDDIEKADRDYYAKKEGLIEHIARLRDLNCYEYPQSIRADKKALKMLFDRGAFRETKDGFYVIEPYYQGILKSLVNDQNNLHKSGLKAKLYETTVTISEFLDHHTPLGSREAFFNEIAFRLEKESAIIFSGTPVILNPAEVNDKKKQYARDVADAFKDKLSQSVFYVWNEQSVINEISELLKDPKTDREEAKRAYCNHFLTYGRNPYLQIYYGDNSFYTKREESIPYISADYAMVGVRGNNGSLIGGSLISKNRPQELAGKIPILGEWLDLPIDLSKKIFDKKNFHILRRSLSEMPIKRFDDFRHDAVADFIENFFRAAERKLEATE